MISAWGLEEKIRQGRIRPWMLSSILSEELEEAKPAKDLAKKSQKRKRLQHSRVSFNPFTNLQQ